MGAQIRDYRVVPVTSSGSVSISSSWRGGCGGKWKLRNEVEGTLLVVCLVRATKPHSVHGEAGN